MFTEKQKREVIEAFKSEYERICPKTCREYDEKYDRAISYCSKRIKRILGVMTWGEILDECGVEKRITTSPITEFILEVI